MVVFHDDFATNDVLSDITAPRFDFNGAPNISGKGGAEIYRR